jgi:hypothetical protein
MGCVTVAGDHERLAVLTVRAWRRLDEPTVVARITASVDAGPPDKVVVTEVGIDAIVEVVRAWLEGIGRPEDVS